MRVLIKYILLASVMLATSVTPSIAEIDCRKFGEGAEWIYKMYKQGEHISDVMDVIDSRGLEGLTKKQSRILALNISENMDYFTFRTVSEVRRFYEQDCFEAKYN
jgi:hypothetical protein